jgi:hypothetical protein
MPRGSFAVVRPTEYPMPQSRLIYVEIPEWTRDAVERTLRDDNPEMLLQAVIAVSMYYADWRYAQDLCVQLSSHWHFNVRGNAILGFGHIARVHGQLDRALVQPIIEAALRDTDDYVRSHGVDAADDTRHFLGWKFDTTDVA